MNRWDFSYGRDEPDRGDRPDRSDDFPGGRAWLTEQPEPGDRQQVWEESRTHMAHMALDMLREKVPPARGADRDVDHRYDAEIPRLTHLWSDHEVQFHTVESFHTKHHTTHRAYERIRDPRTSRAELRELETFQREVSACIPMPEGVGDILDYKKEGF